jgi:protein-S-isoprenylcysteine O-methyltransferase Ste14
VAEDRPNRIPWPPLIYLAAALIAYVLHRLVPLPWVPGVLQAVLYWTGLLLLGAAIATEMWTALVFRKHRTTILPHRAASHLITTGPFVWSRNPIYVGNTTLLVGAGLVFGMAWFCIMALAAAFTTQKLAIEREEKHLAAKFGSAWQTYAARVPRWLL